jgi:hypothetical protein
VGTVDNQNQVFHFPTAQIFSYAQNKQNAGGGFALVKNSCRYHLHTGQVPDATYHWFVQVFRKSEFNWVGVIRGQVVSAGIK